MEKRLDNKAQKRLVGVEKRLNDQIQGQLIAMEKRLDNKGKARFEALLAATTLNKLEFVTRREFEKLKKQVQRIQAN